MVLQQPISDSAYFNSSMHKAEGKLAYLVKFRPSLLITVSVNQQNACELF